jgi:hypothetical protein
MTEQEFRALFRVAFADPPPRAPEATTATSVGRRINRVDGPIHWSAGIAVAALTVVVVATLMVIPRQHTPGAPNSGQSTAMPPTMAVPWLATPSAGGMGSRRVTWAQAQADSPDPLLAPTWRPVGIVGPRIIQDVLGPDGRALVTITEYGSYDGRSVLVEQFHSASEPLIPSPSVDGNIGSQPVKYYDLDSGGNPSAVQVRVSAGVYVSVETLGLTLDELNHLAASLAVR